MERPNMHVMTADVAELRSRLSRLDDAVQDAYTRSLGINPETGADLDEDTGDEAGYFDAMKKEITEARLRLARVEELIATVEGWRALGSVNA
jgi:hypothetical protein